MKKTMSLMALAFAAACGIAGANTAKADIYFRDSDRVVLRQYVPAPGETVTTYSTGDTLPDTVTYTTLPDTVVTTLAPPPPTDVYVGYGGHAYLIDKDRRIVDSISLY